MKKRIQRKKVTYDDHDGIVFAEVIRRYKEDYETGKRIINMSTKSKSCRKNKRAALEAYNNAVDFFNSVDFLDMCDMLSLSPSYIKRKIGGFNGTNTAG